MGDVGKTIKAFMDARGMAQKEFAARINALLPEDQQITYQAVQKVLYGETKKPFFLPEAAQALGVSVKDIRKWKEGTDIPPPVSRPAIEAIAEGDEKEDIYLLRLIGEQILEAVENQTLDMSPKQFAKLLNHLYLRLQGVPAEQRAERARTILSDMLALAIKG